MADDAIAKGEGHKVVGVVLRSSAKTVHFIRHAEGKMRHVRAELDMELIEPATVALPCENEPLNLTVIEYLPTIYAAYPRSMERLLLVCGGRCLREQVSLRILC